MDTEEEVEDIANAYFQRIYTSEQSIEEVHPRNITNSEKIVHVGWWLLYVRFGFSWNKFFFF